MIIIIESEPQFVALKEMTLYTPMGEVHIDKGDPVGLLRTPDGQIHLGKCMEGALTQVLEFNNKTVISDLLESCQPATFELIRDSNGDTSINSILLEEKVLLEDKIERINLCESIPTQTLKVQKIR